MLEQQGEQNGGISRKRIQRRVLLGGVKKYFANGAVRKITDMGHATSAANSPSQVAGDEPFVRVAPLSQLGDHNQQRFLASFA